MNEAVSEQGQRVAAHWSRLAVTFEGALQALGELGIDVANAKPADLHGVDMIHMGGLPATDTFARQAEINPGQRVLDVGAGVGGPVAALRIASAR